MMLDVDFAELRQGFLQYLPIGALVGLIFLVELVLVVGAWATSPGLVKAVESPVISLGTVTNTEAIGRVLYTTYVHYFQLAGIVLLVAMIGAIVLTLRHKPHVRRQDVARQVSRTRAASIEVRKVRPGQGI
jgi:NADH-quinone oxidoreductase subunit J